MNLNTDFKPVTDSPKEPGTRPLYTDGILYWYLDSRSDDYPNEIIQDIVNGIVNEYNLLDLDKMYRKLVYPNANYIELPIHVGYSSYTIMCAKFDDAELQEKLEKDRELLKVADVEIYKLINRIVTKLEKQTGFGFIHDNTFGDDYTLHIKASKYASFILSSDITRYINVNTCSNDKVITVWLKDKDVVKLDDNKQYVVIPESLIANTLLNTNGDNSNVVSGYNYSALNAVFDKEALLDHYHDIVSEITKHDLILNRGVSLELEKIHLSDVSSDVRTNGGWGKLYKEVSGKELNESGFGTVKICDGLYGIKDGLFNIYSQSNKEYSINEF